jgi:hypothetical protein
VAARLARVGLAARLANLVDRRWRWRRVRVTDQAGPVREAMELAAREAAASFCGVEGWADAALASVTRLSRKSSSGFPWGSASALRTLVENRAADEVPSFRRPT